MSPHDVVLMKPTFDRVKPVAAAWTGAYTTLSGFIIGEAYGSAGTAAE